jgi:hypothetical protein
MSRISSRLAAVMLLGSLLSACGGGDDPVSPPATPTAAIAIGAATASIIAGATTPVTVTLTRGGGFAGAVTVTAASLPTGVTASTETIAAGASTATITLTAASTAVAANGAAVSVTGTGSGVTIAPQAFALTVTPGAGATLALAAAAGSVQAGSSNTLVVTVTRTGTFTGSVVIAATALPTGVTVTSQTIAAGATSATLSVAATPTAAAGVTTISISGTGAGVTIAPQPYALTVVPSPISQIGTEITNADGQFGGTIALNADGTRMVVGATTSTGGNGTSRVYQRIGSTWAQLGGDIVGEAADDRSGIGVAINAAGTRIAIGAYLNDGNGSASGQVRVFDLIGSTWTQVGADLDGGGASWGFGWRVALSASGSRLIASGPGVNTNTGFVKVFDLVGGSWTQVGATLTAGNEFGDAVDISSDGTTIAVSSPSAAGSGRVGSVQVFRLSGAAWTQLGNELTEAQNANTQGEGFGASISLTANGSRIAVASPQNKEAAPAGSNHPYGQVRVFDLIGSIWSPVGNAVNGLSDIGINSDNLGETLMLSDDGTRWAATGASNSIAKVYSLVGGAWTQTGATIVPAAGLSVRSEGLALSPDGKTVAVGYVNGSPRHVSVFSIAP